jgi:ABC-type glycerol-3-phosphate transport system substrate-binding protein
VNRPRLTRRAVLRGAAGAAAATVLGGAGSGCAGSGGRTQVAVVWTGHELAMFRRVLRDYPEPIDVISAGDDIDALVRARQRAGTSPDVAIVPRPGLIRGYVERGWLAPIQARVKARFPPTWNDQLRVDGEVFGAWVKSAHKSLFWYLPSLLSGPPSTWDELVAYVGERAAASGPAPLAIGAADGWALTDWLDNLLAATVPARSGLDHDLAAGEPRWGHAAVREAFAEVARVWSVPGAFPGGGRRALVTQFDASVIEVTGGEAVMMGGADFVTGFAEQFPPEPPDRGLGWFRFPPVDGTQRVVVGGDAAVVLHDSPAGHRLVEWLTRPGAFDPWLEAGGYLTPSDSAAMADYPPGFTRELAQDIRQPSVRFDLSDQLPGTASGRDGVGSWLVLQDFFADVTAPSPDVGAAIDRAVGRLDEAVVAAREVLADG